MIVKFKSIKNWQNHIYYLFNEDKHQNQEIIGTNFYNNYNINQNMISKYHLNKNGRPSKMLSIVISFKEGTSKIEAESRFKNVYLQFYTYINKEYALRLNNDELKALVNQIPFVYHGKESNPHFHSFLNRVIYSKSTNQLISIDFSKKKHLNKFRELAGWDISHDSLKATAKNIYTYKLNKLEDQILQYQNINTKIDKYIAIALKDLKRGHTDKALNKLQKIKERNIHDKRKQ